MPAQAWRCHGAPLASKPALLAALLALPPMHTSHMVATGGESGWDAERPSHRPDEKACTICNATAASTSLEVAIVLIGALAAGSCCSCRVAWAAAMPASTAIANSSRGKVARRASLAAAILDGKLKFNYTCRTM